jgi:hypothetical protein
MAKGKGKGKGKGLKKKVLKEKKPEEEKKSLYDIPEYIDPKIYTPEVELTIRLASPPVEHLSNAFPVDVNQLFRIHNEGSGEYED